MRQDLITIKSLATPQPKKWVYHPYVLLLYFRMMVNGQGFN